MLALTILSLHDCSELQTPVLSRPNGPAFVHKPLGVGRGLAEGLHMKKMERRYMRGSGTEQIGAQIHEGVRHRPWHPWIMDLLIIPCLADHL